VYSGRHANCHQHLGWSAHLHAHVDHNPDADLAHPNRHADNDTFADPDRHINADLAYPSRYSHRYTSPHANDNPALIHQTAERAVTAATVKAAEPAALERSN
jgi:hypothetical protein